MLGIVTAATRLFAQGGFFPVTDDLLGWTGNSWIVGGTGITRGMMIMFGLYAFVWYLLTQTAWGRHVYAIGNNRAAARLVGIPVENRCLSDYAFAAFLWGSAHGSLWVVSPTLTRARCKVPISTALRQS